MDTDTVPAKDTATAFVDYDFYATQNLWKTARLWLNLLFMADADTRKRAKLTLSQ